MTTTDTPTRRERLRAELVAQVKDVALAHLRSDGPQGLSLRAVARDVGVSPGALYRYFDGRDALLTALISDGYDDLADHLAAALAATGGHPRARMHAVCAAYRDWGVAHPNQFALLFGTPVQDYAAPADGPTVVAYRRVAAALLDPVLGALDAGTTPRTPDTPTRDAFHADLEGLAGRELPDGTVPFVLGVWGWLHGLACLEVFGHLEWVYPEGLGATFTTAVETRMDELGLPD